MQEISNIQKSNIDRFENFQNYNVILAPHRDSMMCFKRKYLENFIFLAFKLLSGNKLSPTDVSSQKQHW